MPAKGGSKKTDTAKDSNPKTTSKPKKGSEKKDDAPSAAEPQVEASSSKVQETASTSSTATTSTTAATSSTATTSSTTTKAEEPKAQEQTKSSNSKPNPKAKTEAKADSTSVKHPLCKWAESSEAVFLTIEVSDCKNPTISITDTAVTFECNGYKADLKLKHPIKPDDKNTKYAVTDREVAFHLVKKEAERWGGLLADKNLGRNLIRPDFDKWIDSDDDEKDAGGFDMSGLEGGMGGMGGMGMGGGMGGMDMAKMMEMMKNSGGGMGGMGGGDDMGGEEEDNDAEPEDDDLPDLESTSS